MDPADFSRAAGSVMTGRRIRGLFLCLLAAAAVTGASSCAGSPAALRKPAGLNPAEHLRSHSTGAAEKGSRRIALRDENIFFGFEVRGAGRVRSGTFSGRKAGFYYVDGILRGFRGELTASSGHTGEAAFDDYLKDTFLEAGRYPLVILDIPSIIQDGGSFRAEGTLSFKGRDIPCSFPVTLGEDSINAGISLDAGADLQDWGKELYLTMRLRR